MCNLLENKCFQPSQWQAFKEIKPYIISQGKKRKAMSMKLFQIFCYLFLFFACKQVSRPIGKLKVLTA